MRKWLKINISSQLLHSNSYMYTFILGYDYTNELPWHSKGVTLQDNYYTTTLLVYVFPHAVNMRKYFSSPFHLGIAVSHFAKVTV